MVLLVEWSNNFKSMNNTKNQLASGELIIVSRITTSFQLLTTDTATKNIVLKKNGVTLRTIPIVLTANGRESSTWFMEGGILVTNMFNSLIIVEYDNGILTLSPYVNNLSQSFLKIKLDLDVDSITIT